MISLNHTRFQCCLPGHSVDLKGSFGAACPLSHVANPIGKVTESPAKEFSDISPQDLIRKQDLYSRHLSRSCMCSSTENPNEMQPRIRVVFHSNSYSLAHMQTGFCHFSCLCELWYPCWLTQIVFRILQSMCSDLESSTWCWKKLLLPLQNDAAELQH